MKKISILLVLVFISPTLFAQQGKTLRELQNATALSYEGMTKQAAPEPAPECNYTYGEFISQVKSSCKSVQNKEKCVALAKECPDLINRHQVPASAQFMADINADILKAMFEAGLQPPLANYSNKNDYYLFEHHDRNKFLCAMVINHAQKTLPTENFKVVFERIGFERIDLNDTICSTDTAVKIFLKPHEFSVLLDDKALTEYFKEQKVKITEDLFLSIPLDLWAPQYYTTKRSQILLDAMNNPQYLKIIDQNFDFSILMPKGTQILFVGEAHHGAYYKAAADIINGLKCNPGLTHFASEFLLEMQQEDIENFRKTNDACNIQINPRLITSKAGKETLEQFNKTNTACLDALGCDIEIRGLEKTERVIGKKENDSQKAKKEFVKMLDGKINFFEKKQRGLNLINFFARSSSPAGVRDRNYEWAEAIDNDLKKDKSAKAIAYMGKMHSVGYNKELLFRAYLGSGFDSVPELMREKGYNVKILSIAGDHLALLSDSVLFKTLNMQDKYFLFIVPEELREDMGMDYIVHMPSTGEHEKNLKQWLKNKASTEYYNKLTPGQLKVIDQEEKRARQMEKNARDAFKSFR